LLSNHYNFNDLIKNPSFKRWVKSTATEAEQRYWDKWVMKSPENRSVAIKAMQEITGFAIKPGEYTSTDVAFEKLLRQIETGQSPKIHRRVRNKRIRVKSLQWVVRIAAVLLLGYFTVYIATELYQAPAESVGAPEITKTELDTDYGVQKTVQFSDGSEIILNGNSKLVTTKNSSNPSAIELFLEGEAYFSIKPRENPEDSPFQIQTPDGLVHVLGTKLVVSTRQHQTRVFLETGSVAVHPYHLDAETILVPGQLVEFDNDTELLEAQFVNPEIYTSWINGRLYFEQADLAEVLQRIEDTFGVKAVVRDSAILEYIVTGSIESSELEIITSALSVILNISIEKSESDNVIYIGSALD